VNFSFLQSRHFPATLAFMILLRSLAIKLAVSQWVAVVTLAQNVTVIGLDNTSPRLFAKLRITSTREGEEMSVFLI